MRTERGISRRELIAGAAAIPLASCSRSERKRPRIAAIATIYFRHSHAQHIVDRFLDGYGWNATHHKPEMDLVSLYVEQVNERDLSRERAQRHPEMKIYPTIAEALTLGGSKLDVDGIVLIGEHGQYENNEKGQKLYPRYEYFEQIVKVFRDSGRAVPVFNDKHLSWNWEWAKKMYDTSRELNFPFMAGSSLPVTYRTPSLEMPLGSQIEDAVCVCYGGVDSYDFHGLETLQCMVERRKGGESGVKWVQAYRGDNFWKAYKDKVWSHELMESAITRSHTLAQVREGFNDYLPTIDEMKKIVKNPVAYHYEHEDGLRSTLLLMSGLVRDFNFAAHTDKGLLSTQMYLPMPDGRTTLASFFSPLVANMEEMFLTGKPTYPVERTLLTTGLTAAGVESLFLKEAQINTPHLSFHYDAPEKSTYWRT